MNDEIMKFSESLSELLSSGMSLPKSLAVIDGKIAREIRKSVSEGYRFSVALMTCKSASFPDWYVGFVSAAETSGDLGRTFAHISRILSERKSAHEKFIAATAYPLFIVVLTVVCAAISVCSYSTVFASAPESLFDGASTMRIGAIRSCFFGGIFIFFVAFVMIIILRTLLDVNPCASLFRSLSFLTESGVPVVTAIDCSIGIVDRNPRLCSALMSIRAELMGGGNVALAFGKSLSESGFSFESKLALSRLSVSEVSGSIFAFSKIAELIEKRHAKMQKLVLSFEQPFLLCAAAGYLAFVMKNLVGVII